MNPLLVLLATSYFFFGVLRRSLISCERNQNAPGITNIYPAFGVAPSIMLDPRLFDHRNGKLENRFSTWTSLGKPAEEVHFYQRNYHSCSYSEQIVTPSISSDSGAWAHRQNTLYSGKSKFSIFTIVIIIEILRSENARGKKGLLMLKTQDRQDLKVR